MQFQPLPSSVLDEVLLLAPVGTLRDVVVKAATRAQNQYDSAVDPVNARGSLFYLFRVRELRLALLGPDWEHDRYRGLEGVRSVDGRFRILAWSGREEGDPDDLAATAVIHRRGPAGVSVVEKNGRIHSSQGHLFGAPPPDPADLITTLVLIVWWANGRLRADLCLPDRISDLATSYSQLNLLERIEILDIEFPGSGNDYEPPPESPPPDFDIEER